MAASGKQRATVAAAQARCALLEWLWQLAHRAGNKHAKLDAWQGSGCCVLLQALMVARTRARAHACIHTRTHAHAHKRTLRNVQNSSLNAGSRGVTATVASWYESSTVGMVKSYGWSSRWRDG